MWFLHSAFVAAGWTVEQSCGLNGGGPITAGAGDNILSATDIVVNTAGNPHSWAEYSPPVGALASGTLRVLWDINDGVAPYATMNTYHATSAFTGGTTTARPTSTTERLHGGSAVWTTTTVVDPDNSKAHYGWSDVGDFWIVLTRDASAGEAFCYLRITFPDTTKAVSAGGPDDPSTAYVFMRTQANAGCALLGNVSDNEAAFQTGLTPVGGGSVNIYSVVDYMSAFVAGKSAASGKVHGASAELCISVAGSNRYLGKMVDIRWMPWDTPTNTVLAGDTDPVRYVAISSAAGVSIGPAMWVPVTASQLPIT